MSLSTVTKAPLWSPVTINKINGPSRKNVVSHRQFIIILLVGRRSILSVRSKIMLYEATLKSVWTYGIQLWGRASNSNIEIRQRFQSKTLRSLIDAPCYVTNETIRRDLKIPTAEEEISKFSNRYNIEINNHQNPLITRLLDTTDQIRRLKRHYPVDLNIRFS